MASQDGFSGNNYNHFPREEEDGGIDLEFLISAALRQWKIVASAMLIGLMLGVAYLMSATPLYTSSTRIFYQKSQTKAIDELAIENSIFGDETEFASQLELIKSERIAEKVVEALDLHLNEDFLSEGRSGLTSVISVVREIFDIGSWFSDAELSEAELASRKGAAAGKLMRNVGVSRVGRTYIIQLNYTSESPALAQKITAQFATSYLNDQLDSKYDSTRRASDWLQTRITELKEQSLVAELAVQKFREDNNLVRAGSGPNLAEAQLAGANAQLIAAKGEVADAKAQYDKLDAAIKAGDVSIAVDASLDSSIITGLREKYLELSKRAAEFSGKLGEQHIQVVNLRNEMREYQRLMFDELSRIRDSFKSKYDIALERQRTLQANLQSMVGATSSANKVQVKLRELEREATTIKSLLENFLTRYQESLQQQSFPVNDARIVAKAYRPGAPSHPNKLMSLVVALFLGAAVGGGIGAFREFRERFFRTGDQVRDALGLEFLGLIPKVAPENSWSTKQSSSQEKSATFIRHANGMTNYVSRQPLSSFAEALRGAKVAADITLDAHGSKVIGVISCLPSEGKSTVSSNLSQLLALQGAPTLLIDGDMRNPGLTRSVARHASSGLVEVLMGEQRIEQAMMSDPDLPGLRVLPAAIKSRISHTSDLLTSQHMQRLLMLAREKFSYVIVDLPPVAPVVDVKAFASRVDGFVFVVEWGKTSRSLVKSILSANPAIREKCLGVVLNKAEMDQMKLYRAYGSSDYYYSSYSSYYRDDKDLAKKEAGE